MIKEYRFNQIQILKSDNIHKLTEVKMIFNNALAFFKRRKQFFKLSALIAVTVAVISSCGGGSEGGEFTVIKDTKLGPINQAQAEQGKKIFAEKCASCHKYDIKLVGPPLGDVVKRRSADYILSQILYPEQMITNNDTVKALLSKYMTQMSNQHLSMLDAKAVLEHLRVVVENGGKK